MLGDWDYLAFSWNTFLLICNLSIFSIYSVFELRVKTLKPWQAQALIWKQVSTLEIVISAVLCQHVVCVIKKAKYSFLSPIPRFPSKFGRHWETAGAVGAPPAEKKEENSSALSQQRKVGRNAGGGRPKNGGVSWEQSCGELRPRCHEHCEYATFQPIPFNQIISHVCRLEFKPVGG